MEGGTGVSEAVSEKAAVSRKAARPETTPRERTPDGEASAASCASAGGNDKTSAPATPSEASETTETPARPEAPEAPDASGESVAPLQRGLAVLRAVAASPDRLVRPGDLTRATGLARSTVDRVISTLSHLDYLRAEGRDVALAPRLMEFGNAYLASSGLSAVLEPLAVRLANRLDESVSVAVPDGCGVRFVTQTTRRRAMSLEFRIGDLLPPERCAPGTLFAADWGERDYAELERRLEADPGGAGFPAVPARTDRAKPAQVRDDFTARVREARRSGWAVDDQLIEPGLIAVAVPVRGPSGAIRCALSVVSHTSRHSAASLRGHALAELRDTARRMEAALADPGSGAAARAGEGNPVRGRTFDESKRELGPHFLRSLARGLDALSALGSRPGGMTLSAVAEATALPRATARRALLTLREEGYVEADGRLFRPLPRVLELGYARLSGMAIEELARPHLVRLAESVRESASVAVLSGSEISYVARVATRRIMQVNITVGTRFPAFATSMGRVLLAGLPEPARTARLRGAALDPLTRFTVTDPAHLAAILDQVADDGYALVDQELEEGLRSIAAPVRDARGRVVAAVNVSTHAGRDEPERVREQILPALLEAAARISEDLAAVGERPAMPEL
jgi:IclR family transcriptional regulator, pca regulon regulatory protein